MLADLAARDLVEFGVHAPGRPWNGRTLSYGPRAGGTWRAALVANLTVDRDLALAALRARR